MLTLIVGPNNDRCIAVLHKLAQGAPEVTASDTDPISFGLSEDKTQLHVVTLPEDLRHPSRHAPIGDALLALASAGTPLLVWTHSKAIYFRICRRVAEKAVDHTKVSVLWCAAEPRMYRFSPLGQFEGIDADKPMPRMFGEEEEHAEFMAIQQAVILAVNEGKPPKELFRQVIALPDAVPQKTVEK